MKEKFKPVQHVTVSSEESGRRIDNYLFARLKAVPKTRIYRMLRKGEVRLNGGRVKQDRKLQAGDVIRIPPVQMDDIPAGTPPPALVKRLSESVIFENEALLAINKPAGISVHGGSRDPYGVIEALRAVGKEYAGLQLAHRLDRMTSGCLLLCKRMDMLRDINRLIAAGDTTKSYLALVKGHPDEEFTVDLPLKKGSLRGGERVVRVDDTGKSARTRFRSRQHYRQCTLVDVDLLTGRTHQIRVHAAESGHPLALDIKYGDDSFNRKMKQLGLPRMFLHAASLTLPLPGTSRTIDIEAPLPGEMKHFLLTEGL